MPILDSAHSWYVLSLIAAAYGLSFIDRQLLNLLVDPLKHSLGLSDVQVSFLQGAAFVTAYCISAPILGRIVDVANRRNVLLFCVATWSLCTALCGLASGFWSFAAARFGVGVAEACIFPVAWSLIPELFSPAKGARAYSIFALGSNMGGAFSLLFGGAVVGAAGTLVVQISPLAGFQPWQMAFVIVGLPGLLFCALLLTIREPARPLDVSDGNTVLDKSFGASAALLRQRWRFYLPVYFGNGMLSIVALSIPAWFPAFLSRAYSVGTASIGLFFGLTLLACSTAGLLLGPVLAQRLARRGFADAPLRVASCSTIGMTLASLILPVFPSMGGAIVSVGLLTFFTTICTPLIGSATQAATPSHMRGFVSSLFTFTAMSIGYAVGPLLIAAFTDHFFHDPRMVGHSLQIVCAVSSVLCGLSFLAICRPFRELVGES